MLHSLDKSFNLYYEIRTVKWYSHFEVDMYFLGERFIVYHWKVMRDSLGFFAIYSTHVSSNDKYPHTFFHCSVRSRLEALNYILSIFV